MTHSGDSATVKRAITYVEHRGILDDLDVRASDLLQSNCIVWVEGPSDRLYFNRWMDLWSEGKIREGAHYQCVFYGGRLLAHLSANDPNVNPDDVVKVLRVNRNAIVLIDSDRREHGQAINETKQRIVREIEDVDGFAWVTAGRQIEHYIPTDAIRSLYPDHPDHNVAPCGEFVDFSDYLDGINQDEGQRFVRRKVLFAERISPLITRESMADSLDLSDRIAVAHECILRWNGQAKGH